MTVSQEDDRIQQLIQKIAPQSTLLRVWPLKGGISAEMTALDIELPDGQTRQLIVRRPGDEALRQNPRAVQDEYRLLQITQSLGLATPAPLYLDETDEIFPTPYMVIDYIEGKPEFAPAHLTDFCLQLATHLARIHRVAGTNFDLSFLPDEAKGYIHTLGHRPAQVDEYLEEGRIRDILEPIWPLPQRNASVLLHGDYWPGNVLWRDGKLVGVIDWEDASLGDPLGDLAISRLDLMWIYGMDAMNAFTRRYESVMAIDYTDLPYWDLYAALRFIRLAGSQLAEWAAFFGPFGRPDITEQTIRELYGFFVTQATEKMADR